MLIYSCYTNLLFRTKVNIEKPENEDIHAFETEPLSKFKKTFAAFYEEK